MSFIIRSYITQPNTILRRWYFKNGGNVSQLVPESGMILNIQDVEKDKEYDDSRLRIFAHLKDRTILYMFK